MTKTIAALTYDLAIVLTVGISVYAHGVTAGPLTDRYVGWFASHPEDRKPAMESVTAAEHRWRRPHVGGTRS